MSASPASSIRLAQTPAEIDAIRSLWLAYADEVKVAACFQTLAQELAALPDPYHPPAGFLVLAGPPEAPQGCLAVGAVAPGIAELRRLYVRPESRGQSMGAQMIRYALSRMAAGDSTHLVLHTLEPMRSARALYAQLGFVAIPPYRPGLPVESQSFLLPLHAGAGLDLPAILPFPLQTPAGGLCQSPTKSAQ